MRIRTCGNAGGWKRCFVYSQNPCSWDVYKDLCWKKKNPLNRHNSMESFSRLIPGQRIRSLSWEYCLRARNAFLIGQGFWTGSSKNNSQHWGFFFFFPFRFLFGTGKAGGLKPVCEILEQINTSSTAISLTPTLRIPPSRGQIMLLKSSGRQCVDPAFISWRVLCARLYGSTSRYKEWVVFALSSLSLVHVL